MPEKKPEHLHYHAILTRLRERYPYAFPPDEVKPLKVGTRHDLMASDETLKPMLRKFMYWYTHRQSYLKKLVAGTVRVDLNGNPAGEVTAEQEQFAKTGRQQKQPNNALPLDIPLTEDNIVPGKLEITLKFNELPKPVQVQAGYKFALDCGDGRRVSVTLKPKMWNKLTAAAASYPQWVASVTGKMGPSEGNGFVLLEPAVQVFEKKPKVPEGNPPVASTPPPSGRPKLSLKSK